MHLPDGIWVWLFRRSFYGEGLFQAWGTIIASTY